jgi:hypothetical protein
MSNNNLVQVLMATELEDLKYKFENVKIDKLVFSRFYSNIFKSKTCHCINKSLRYYNIKKLFKL